MWECLPSSASSALTSDSGWSVTNENVSVKEESWWAVKVI